MTKKFTKSGPMPGKKKRRKPKPASARAAIARHRYVAALAFAPLLATQAVAQTYTNYDGTKTSDMNAALATWVNAPEFKYNSWPIQGDWGLAAMNAQYAYVLGFSGKGVKLGSVDSGLFTAHEEFAGRSNIFPITISGTYLNDGAQLDGNGLTWKAGDPFRTPGTWNGTADLANHIGKNDNHGSHVSGTIAAAKNGLDKNNSGMMGVAWGSDYYITNSNGTDNSLYGSNVDYNYFYQAYDQLAKAGVRVINSSWGSPVGGDDVGTISGMSAAYARLESLDQNSVSRKKSWLDAAADVSLQTGVIQVFAAGNKGYDNPNIRASAPYFRPEIEKSWIAVEALNHDLSKAGFSNACGVAKYFCLSAPGVDINSLQTIADGYVPEPGTSMAAPHVTGALGILMERYPGLDNDAIRTILLTTATHLGTGPAEVPNAGYGWGIPDLRKGMDGPGQLLGSFNANILSGTTDIWSNPISEAALKQRKVEERAEVAGWPAVKAALLARLQQVLPARTPGADVISGIPTAKALLQAAINANIRGTHTAANLHAAIAAANANPVGALLMASYDAAHPGWTAGWSRDTDFDTFIAGRNDTQLATDIFNPNRTAAIVANAPINNQILLTQGRIDALSAKTDADYVGSMVKLGGGTLILTGNNSYSGGTSLVEGTLGVGNSTALGTGRLTSHDGTTLGFYADSLNLANAITLADGKTTFDSQAYKATLSGAIDGAGGLEKIGTGSLVLAGTANYSGATLVTQGTLQGGAVNAFSPLSTHMVAAGGTLDLGGFGQTIGSLIGAGVVTNSGTNTAILTTGGSNAPLSIFTGVIRDDGAIGLTKVGTGLMMLMGQNAYSGPTTVAGGTLEVDGSIASSPVHVQSGAFLAGTGTVGTTSVSRGGKLAPGNLSTPTGTLTVNGSLALASGATYLVTVSGSTFSRTDVKGSASLGGATMEALFLPGSYLSRKYAIVTATGGVSGSFGGLASTNLPSNFAASNSYDANRAYLDLNLDFGGTAKMTANQRSVAGALARSFNTAGGISMAYGALTPQGLTQASGEVAAAGQQSTLDVVNGFTRLLLDPMIEGRSSSSTPGPALPPAAESAYAATGTKPPSDAFAAMIPKGWPALAYEPQWNVWATGYAGGQSTDGNATTGSSTTSAAIYGTVVGADYRIAPGSLIGLAVAGAGTTYRLAGGPDNGRADVFQAGVYGRHDIGAAYVSGALAYGRQDITTDRKLMADVLRGHFGANALSGRLESGYRFDTAWVGLTPYAAGSFTTLDLPSYAESVVAGPGLFALRYVSKEVTDWRSEFGLRTDKSMPINNGSARLTLRGQAAWGHNFNTDRSVQAAFLGLPASGFVVNGAAPAANLALVSGSAEVAWKGGLSLAAKFGTEQSRISQSYTGQVIAKMQW
ncbi:autotransporter domain-containing protein [Bradyrhizobium sp. USDA 4454]